MDLRECTLHSLLQKKLNKAELTLSLKPKVDVTRNPKQGYQWPQKGHTCVRPKTLKKTLKKNHGVSSLEVFHILYKYYCFSDQYESNEKNRTENEDTTEDDYEEWKHKILANAHKALGKTYKRS